jgi:hypothetical protein
LPGLCAAEQEAPLRGPGVVVVWREAGAEGSAPGLPIACEMEENEIRRELAVG